MAILLIFHIFCSFFTFTTLWGSLLNENIIGESSNFLQIVPFHIYCSVLKILARCIFYMCFFNFRGYQIYSYMFYIDTDVLIQTLFILKYVNVFIPLASSIQCNLNIQSTKHHWNQDVSMYTLKVFSKFSLNIDIFLHVLFPCVSPDF